MHQINSSYAEYKSPRRATFKSVVDTFHSEEYGDGSFTEGALLYPEHLKYDGEDFYVDHDAEVGFSYSLKSQFPPFSITRDADGGVVLYSGSRSMLPTEFVEARRVEMAPYPSKVTYIKGVLLAHYGKVRKKGDKAIHYTAYSNLVDTPIDFWKVTEMGSKTNWLQYFKDTETV